MKTMFWFALGVGATAFVVIKGRKLLAKATPAGISQQVQHKAEGIGQQVSTFFQTVSDSMKEREAELRSELGLDENDQPGTVAAR